MLHSHKSIFLKNYIISSNVYWDISSINLSNALYIIPEVHYPIVGASLLVPIKEVLDAVATDEVIEAYGKAYRVIAQIFLDSEKEIFESRK